MNFKLKFESFKSFINKNKLDILALAFLILFMVILTYFLLQIDAKIGTYYIRDVFSYLNNSLRFAGYPAGLENMKGLSPFIPFLTSLLFRMGFVYDWAIMLVSSLFYILSGIGMYLLLRLRFKQALSCCGAIILITFSMNLAWATKGMLDIPGMALSIFAVYFMYLGVKNNNKYFYLAFPIFILGFFTRYTVILTLPVMLILILFEERPFKFIKDNFKNLFGGIILGFITTIPFLLNYYMNKIPLFFLSQTEAISHETAEVASSTVSIGSYLAKNSIFYYLNNLPIYMSTFEFPPYSIKSGRFLFDELRWIGGSPSIIAYIFLGILVIGLIIYLYKLFNKNNRNLIFNKEDIKNKKVYIKIILFILFLALTIVTFGTISVVYSLVLFSLAILVLYRLLYKANIKYFELDMLMLYFFMVNLIFYSSHLIKVGRYFITLTPPLAYFIILGLYLIIKKLINIKNKSNNKNSNNYNNIDNINNTDNNSNNNNNCNNNSNNSNNNKKSNSYNNTNKNISEIKAQTIVSIVLIAILTISTAFCFTNQPITYDNQLPDNIMAASQNEKDMANWLINYDPNYNETVIWADRGGDFSFFLRMNIPSLEHYSNQTNFTDMLLKNNVSYFISNNTNTNIGNEYKMIKNIGDVYLYKKVI